MSVPEWIATLLGIACVALGVVRSVWTFPLGIASVALLGWVVLGQRLYSDAGLQLFYVGANAYGWWNWARARNDTGEVRVGRLSAGARLAWVAGTAAAAIGWGAGMARIGAALPWWDAGVAAASVAAQILMARRRVENWAVWIAVDVASVPLYLAKHLWLFAGLYVIYLALSVWGWLDWRRAERATGGRAPA